MFVDRWQAAATNGIKRAAPLGLFVSFSLPISQCTYESNPESGTKEKQVIVTYPYTAYSWSSMERVGTYVAFLWPMALTIAGVVLPGARDKSALIALEL